MINQIIYYAIVVAVVILGMTVLMAKDKDTSWVVVFEIYWKAMLFISLLLGGMFVLLYVLPKILGLPTVTIRT